MNIEFGEFQEEQVQSAIEFKLNLGGESGTNRLAELEELGVSGNNKVVIEFTTDNQDELLEFISLDNLLALEKMEMLKDMADSMVTIEKEKMGDDKVLVIVSSTYID